MEFLDLATDAYLSIGIIDATEVPSAEQGVNAQRALNQIMASLAGDGIDLGYAPSTTITDDVTLPLESQATIIAMLAMKLASDNGIPIPELVAYTAENGRNRLLRQSMLLAQKPLTLAGFSHGAGAGDYYDIRTG